MSTDTLEHALQELPGGQTLPTSTHVKRLAQLIDGEQPLQPFLEQLVPQLADMFSAVAGVAWLKAHAAGDAIFGVPFQMDRVIQSPLDQKKHEKLVQLAWQQRQPMMAEPQVAPGKKSASTKSTSPANPTSHALLFGPVMHFGEPIALIELVLPTLDVPLSPDQKKLFLRSIQLIGERVHGGLKQRMSLPAATIHQAVEQVRLLSEEIAGLQQQIRRTIEARIQMFHGWSFGLWKRTSVLPRCCINCLITTGCASNAQSVVMLRF